MPRGSLWGAPGRAAGGRAAGAVPPPTRGSASGREPSGEAASPKDTRRRLRRRPAPKASDEVTADIRLPVGTDLEATDAIEGLGDWPPMMLLLQGDDLDGLLAQGNRLKAMLAAVPGSSDVRLTVTPGQPVASDRGIPAGLAGSTARMLVHGETVGALRDGGREADIRVRAAPRFSMELNAPPS